MSNRYQHMIERFKEDALNAEAAYHGSGGEERYLIAAEAYRIAVTALEDAETRARETGVVSRESYTEGVAEYTETKFTDGSRVIKTRLQLPDVKGRLRWVNEYHGAEFEGDRERRISATAHHEAVANGFFTR